MPIHAEVSGKQGTSLGFIARGHVVTTLAASRSRGGLPLPSVPLLCLAPSSRDFAVVPGAASGGALGEWVLAFGGWSSCGRSWWRGAGPAVHHPGAPGRWPSRGLEVAPEGRGQRQPVQQVCRHRHHCPATGSCKLRTWERRLPGSLAVSWGVGPAPGSRMPVHPPLGLWGRASRPSLPPCAYRGQLEIGGPAFVSLNPVCLQT